MDTRTQGDSVPCRGCRGSMDGEPLQRRFCSTCRPPIFEGFRYGTRTALHPVTTSTGKRAWMMRCDCGREDVVQEVAIYMGKRGKRCRDCAGLARRKPRNDFTTGSRAGTNGPVPAIAPWADGHPYAVNDLRYEDDPEAQRFVHEHPDGATLNEVGAVFGLSRERVRQIEAEALSKLLRRARLNSVLRERASGQGWGSTSSAGHTNNGKVTQLPARGRGGQG